MSESPDSPQDSDSYNSEGSKIRDPKKMRPGPEGPGLTNYPR